MAAENFGNQGGNAFITGIAFTDNSTQNNFYEVSEGISGVTVRAANAAGTVFTAKTSSSGGLHAASSKRRLFRYRIGQRPRFRRHFKTL